MRFMAALAILMAVNLPSVAQAQQTAWKIVPNEMSDGRWAPAACILPRPNSALIAGGYSYAIHACVATIDIYSESSGRFHRSHARLTYPSDFVEANTLPDGTVLLSGGFNDVWGSMNFADIYDPASDECRPARGKMNQHRELFTAVNLSDGSVLLVGGLDLWSRHTVATAEVYNPSTELFTPTVGNLSQDRFGQAACLLADGRVLVVGGTHWSLTTKETRVLESAEIYDPATGLFHRTVGALQVARDRPTATLLPSGKVLIFGGQGAGGKPVTSAELFDPLTELFSTIAAPALAPRMAHSAVWLASAAKVLIAGGWDASLKATTSTDLLYDPATSQFSPLPDLPFAAHDEALIDFPDGVVLVAGGKSVEKFRSNSIKAGAVLTMRP